MSIFTLTGYSFLSIANASFYLAEFAHASSKRSFINTDYTFISHSKLHLSGKFLQLCLT